MAAETENAQKTGLIEFEMDSEWQRCIYSDYSRSGPQCSRNNSSSNIAEHEAIQYKAPKRNFLDTCPKTIRHNIEALSLRRDAHSVTLRLCVRKHNYENYLWQFVYQGDFKGTEAYSNLQLWTVQLRVRMNRRVPFGCLQRGLRSRLGLGSTFEALKLCLDGFYGMPGFGDIFGNHSDNAVPWMEISNQSTADSLHLCDGDIIFVSYSNEKLESLARARKRAVMVQADNRSFPETPLLEAGHDINDKQFESASHNALPLIGWAKKPCLLTTGTLSIKSEHRKAQAQMHLSKPMYIAGAATSVDSYFSHTVVNNLNADLDGAWDAVSTLIVFSSDGLSLQPEALKQLHQAPFKTRDLVRVNHPNPRNHEGLDLVLSPELMAWILDAANDNHTLHPLLAEVRASAFRCNSAADVDVADGIGVGAGAGYGGLEELRVFAHELDERLRVRCTSAGGGESLDGWTPESATYFVVDTFFASSISCIYGMGKNSRLQPYAIDSALAVIEQHQAASLSKSNDSNSRPRAKLDRAWETIYDLHPASQELACAEPCRHLKMLLHRFKKQRNVSWKSFVGTSVSCLYSDFCAKKAAFWAINYLVLKPGVYEALIAEIDAMSSERGQSEIHTLTLGQLEAMPFLDAFVKEVYRHTAGQFVSFKVGTDLFLQTRQETAGINLRKGCETGVLLRTLNMNPSLFSHPEAFQPQRFLSGSQPAKLLPLPFGCLWPRRRIALLKLKLFLVILLSHCQIRAGRGPAAGVDSSAFTIDVLPWTNDFQFEFKTRDRSKVAFALT